MKRVIVSGAFDDLRFRDYRFIEEASKLGTLHVLLWSDDAVKAATGTAPKFPQAEREYSMQAIRYVSSITLLHGANNPDALPKIDAEPAPDIWAVPQSADTPAKRAWASKSGTGLGYRVISDATLNIVPPAPPVPDNPQS